MGGCVWGVGEVRVGRGRDACTGLGKFAPLKRATWGNGSARCKSARTSASYTRPPVRPPRAPASPPHRLPTADCAPPAHLLPQYCTLLGKTRPRHRPHSGTAGTASSPRHICCPSTSGSHRLPTPPGTTRPPANPNPTCKQRNAAPTEMVDAASTPKGE